MRRGEHRGGEERGDETVEEEKDGADVREVHS